MHYKVHHLRFLRMLYLSKCQKFMDILYVHIRVYMYKYYCHIAFVLMFKAYYYN